MTTEKLLESISKHHHAETKNFNSFMSVLYGAVAWVSVMILVVLRAIAFINPLWFRQSLRDFVTNNVPRFFRNLRELLFKSYKNKVNLFETLKD